MIWQSFVRRRVRGADENISVVELLKQSHSGPTVFFAARGSRAGVSMLSNPMYLNQRTYGLDSLRCSLSHHDARREEAGARSGLDIDTGIVVLGASGDPGLDTWSACSLVEASCVRLVEESGI